MSILDDVKKLTDSHAIVRGVEETVRGHMRIETSFLYPEGSFVDLFVPADNTLFPQVKLTDFGQTMQWLLDVQVRPWLSKKRQRYVEDALRLYGVAQQGGALEIGLDKLQDIVDGVVRLGQACVRVSDLIYTRRSSLQGAFNEEVEEVLADRDLEYEPNVELEGRFGTKVRVDYLVRGRHTRSGVLTWSSGNTSQAHIQANEIFRRWYDLDVPTRKEQRVTVFDDRYDAYRDDDLRRLRDKSEVVALSDRTTVLDLLAA
jgi:hypothetical protein